MSKLVTPMDFALAGLGLWRRQAQTVAITGLRMSGVASSWMMAPSDAMEAVSEAQVEFALATKKASLAMLDAAHGDRQ
ncbi:MAG: hypothetical protein AAGG09_20495 [Pseudomonadota bacterium]